MVGVALLGLAWVLLWRGAGSGPLLPGRRLWWVVAAWTAPLLFAAPLASQDVWHYGAEGQMVLDGYGAYRPASVLGHSVWTLAVDNKWATRPPLYGPGALDLSAFFVKLSGGRPWVAAECWRLTAVIGLVLCAWGVTRIVSRHGANPTRATLAAAANPALLIIVVGGIHNDALMLGLIVAGIALVLGGRRGWGVVLCAVGASVKPNALLALGALAWWMGGGRRLPARAKDILATTTALVGVLVVSGLGVGGGFGWFTALVSYRWVPGPWSLGSRAFGAGSGWPVAAIEMTGVAVAVLLVLVGRRDRRWLVSLGWAFAALAITTPTPEPWYLAWAVALLACGGLDRRSERVGLAVLSGMMVGSLVPPGPFWWFGGALVLAWLGARALRAGGRAPARPSAGDGRRAAQPLGSRMTTGI
jgi:alpha-1,6-mannosyltransferase